MKFALKTAQILCDDRYNAFILERMASVENNFDKYFWNGRYYAAGDFVDDRANALAVLSTQANSAPSAVKENRLTAGLVPAALLIKGNSART